jgi:alpha-ketoglutarate-dependent taurine dioxygenase
MSGHREFVELTPAFDDVLSSDITFESNPSDYAALKIHTLPKVGGDTLWGSAYEVYDRISAPIQKLLEGLTATHDANFFHEEARRLGIPIKSKGRGHPNNSGEDLRAVHPVVRTNRTLFMIQKH